MKRLRRENPSFSEPYIGIEDKTITKIVCNENSVEFHFGDGFDLIENGEVTTTRQGYIELEGCDADDFDCNIIKRRPSRKGAKLRGEPISLEELSEMLKHGDSVEIFLELYGSNYLYWRGELSPHNMMNRYIRRLAPWVTIETMDFSTMTFTWE